MGLILRTSNIQLPAGATVSDIPLSAEQMDNNFIFLQNSGGGIYIPEPQIHINGGGLAYTHTTNSKINEVYRNSSPNLNHMNEEFNGLGLYWIGNDKSFMSCDPHFFLFRHTNKGTRHKISGGPNQRPAGAKKNSCFVHPPNNAGPMFSNFSSGFGSSWGNTEWLVGTASFLTNLNLNSRSYYNMQGNNYLSTHFFPRTITDWNTNVSIRGYKGKSLKKRPKKIVLSFAIVIRDPKDTNKYIVGPMSKTLIISPKIGIFSIPNIYINEKVFNIPNSPDWTLTDVTSKHIFYGWKAYTK